MWSIYLATWQKAAVHGGAEVGGEETHYELMISKTPDEDIHYSNLLLIADLLSRRCQICRVVDHWSRLDGFIGTTNYDAFVITEWLNSFRTIKNLFATTDNNICIYNFPWREIRVLSFNWLLEK